jgi:hypothetical protein
MDYTTILSRLEALFSGNSGVYLIAAICAFGIIGAHFLRMRSTNSGTVSKSKSYRDVVIAPYVEDEFADPATAMMPRFPTNNK